MFQSVTATSSREYTGPTAGSARYVTRSECRLGFMGSGSAGATYGLAVYVTLVIR